MPKEELIESLTSAEKKTLIALEDKFLSLEEIAKKAKLNIDAVRRSIAWLEEKGFAQIKITEKEIFSLTDEGKEALERGLAEKILLEKIKRLKKSSIEELQKETNLGKEFNKALGIAKKMAWISIKKENNKTIIEFTGLEEGKEEIITKEKILKEVYERGESKLDEKLLKELMQRGLITKEKQKIIFARISEEGKKIKPKIEIKEEIVVLNSKIIKEGLWKKAKFKPFNIHEPTPPLIKGKFHPYVEFLNETRERLIAMGFEELETPTIIPEFFNFDILFQPQNHPARAWTETFRLKKPEKGILPNKKIVDAIRAAHENGGITKSKGWGYKWNEEIAKRLMPAAHTTAYTAMKLLKLEIPGKYFAMSRTYRPDVIDATHSIEFVQLDGIVVDENLSFRELLGILKQFALEIANAKKVKFYPDYYPFTEPSVQLSAKHPKLGWVEFAGAGIFRPEITENLGIKQKVLAWGMGIDRLAMFKLGIKDIRELFSQNLEWLRNISMR